MLTRSKYLKSALALRSMYDGWMFVPKQAKQANNGTECNETSGSYEG